MILRFASGSLSPRERLEEALLGIHPDHLHAQCVGEGAHHLVALTKPQQAMIDEHAGQLIADRPLQQRRDHRGVDAAGQPQQHLARRRPARARAPRRSSMMLPARPERVAAADLAHEALQNRAPWRGVRDLRVKLHAVNRRRSSAIAA